MNVTQQIRDILAVQEACFPDRDPGDVEITVQDDSMLCTCSQGGRWFPAVQGYGSTVEEAVEMWAENAIHTLSLDLRAEALGGG